MSKNSIWPIDRTLSGATSPSRVDLVAIAMKGYSTFHKAPRLDIRRQIVLCHTQDICWGILTPLQRCSRCILHFKPTRLLLKWGTIRQFNILLPRSWFASMVWSTASESTALIATREKFLELSRYCTVINCTFTFRTANVFGYFRSVMDQFELVKQKFPMKTTLNVHLCSFHITRRKKMLNVSAHQIPWYTILLITADMFHGLSCFDHMINASQTSIYYQNIAELLTYFSMIIHFQLLRHPMETFFNEQQID